jgi:hypothetical protein
MTHDILFEDYKLKLTYLTAQYDRMWTRFNFFLGTELAIFGFLGYLTFDVKLPTRLPIFVGLAVSALWYIIGAQDHALVEEYRKRTARTAGVLSRHVDGRPGYGALHPAAVVRSHCRGLLSWYWRPISITRLPAAIGIALFVVWLSFLFCWPGFALRLAKDAHGQHQDTHRSSM